MNKIFINWRTSLAAIAPFLVAAGDLATQAATGHWDANRLLIDLGLGSAAGGLVVSKDAHATEPPAAH